MCFLFPSDTAHMKIQIAPFTKSESETDAGLETETEQRQSHVSRISVASPSHLWRMSLSCRLYLCRISVAPSHTLPSGPHLGPIKGTTQRTPPLPHRPHLGPIQALAMQKTKSDRRRNYNHFANVVVVVVS